MKRTRSLIALTILALLATACGGRGAATTTVGDAAGCGVEELDLVQPGVLTVATGEPAFPPWVIDDDPTNQQGFESGVVYALAEAMGFTPDQVVWTRTGFDEAIAPGPKDFDFNIQQYAITDARDEVVDFSASYYITPQALVAYADSPVVEANTVTDLKAYSLGAQIGTTSLAYIEDVIQPDTAPPVYDTNSDAKSALDAGQVDALVFDLPTAFYITSVEIPEATIVGVLETSEEQADHFGMLFAEGSSLVPCVNAALEELRAAGTLDALAEEWLVEEGSIKTITR